MNVGTRNITAGVGTRQKRRRKPRRRSDLIRVNVSGREFYIYDSDLRLYPESLLGSREREGYYQPALKSYFFDRNRTVFEYIASFYQSGYLNLPAELDGRLIKDELDFFRLGENPVEGSETVSSVKKVPKTLKAKMHLFLNKPSYSVYSAIWAGVDMALILIGILLYCLETEPSLKAHFRDENDPYYPYLWWLQTSITIFFTIDLVLRALSWPKINKFFSEPINLLDFISIIPFYIQYLMDALHVQDSKVLISIGRLFRMIRVVRVVKFFRYFKEMFLIIQFIASAWKELILIICLTSMLLIIFGSILYNVENDKNKDKFYSIAQGFWWSLTTITTVGYGDVYPKTWLGQLSGSLLVIISLVVLTLPMTIIITKFNYAYEVEKRQYQQQLSSESSDEEDSDPETLRNSVNFFDSDIDSDF